jgi:hypothetical protein
MIQISISTRMAYLYHELSELQWDFFYSDGVLVHLLYY